MFNIIRDYKRYIDLLKRYLNYVYSTAFFCSDKNFLHKDYGGLYGNLYSNEDDSPYIESLRVLKEKIEANKIYGIGPIIDSLMERMKVFVSFTDDKFRDNYIWLLHYIERFYIDIQVRFFRVLLKKHGDILEKILGKSEFPNEIRDLCYADFLFSLEEEIIYAPDYSIAANARLKKQKGLFLISGSDGRIATKKYHKLSIAGSAKKQILMQLQNKQFQQKKCLCPWRKTSCRVCSCRNGFSFETVYGDLYGQSKAIELIEKPQK